MFKKRSANWSVVPVKVPKSYPYLQTLQERTVRMCLDDKLPMSRKRELPPNHPKHIRPVIASVLPPSTSALAKAQQSRFPKVAPQESEHDKSTSDASV